MKSRFFARSCLLVGIVVGLWMCSKEPTVPPIGSNEPLYSVAQARAFYHRTGTTTRAIAASGPLTPGDYALDWERAEVSLDSLLSSVDVPIDMQYRYYRYLQPAPDSVELVPIYSKLVVVKEHPTLLEGCYIRYAMPARSMIRAYPDYDYDALLNSRPKTGFTGVSLYTDLHGWPMCVAYYYEGELLFDAFLFDKAHTLEENLEQLYNLIGDLTVARCSQATTRAQKDSPILDGGQIEEIVCIGQRPQTEDPEPEIVFDKNSDHPKPINFKVETGLGSGGGSSSGNNGSDNSDSSSKHNDKIKFEDEETEEAVEPLLDSISQDCMGKTLLEALDGVTIKIHPYSELLKYDQYDFKDNIIHLEADESGNYRDYILLEELIHRYQYQQGYTTKCIEKEVEAKVGWALFLYRRHDRNAERGVKNAKQEIRSLMSSTHCGTSALADAICFGYQTNDSRYTLLYEDAIKQLRTKYSKELYPSTYDQSLRNLENIFHLMINCL